MADQIAFTTVSLQKLKALDKPYEVREIGKTGLRLRVSPTGVKSFRWVCRSRNTVFTLGQFGDGAGGTVTLSDARKKLEDYKTKHEAGVDPEGAARGERPRTVKQLCDAFYRDEILPNRKRPESVKDIIDRDIIPTIGTLPLAAVDTITAGEPARAAVARGSKVHAGKVLQIVKQLFSFAADNGFMPMSPAASLKPKRLGAKTAATGKRWLRTSELVTFWKALDRSRMDPVTRFGLRLLLLTALRTNEALSLKWRDVDFDKKTITVRAENRKMSPQRADEAGDWTQPLSDAAVDVLKALRAICPKDKEWVFYSARSADSQVDDHALGRAMKRLWDDDEELKTALAKLTDKANSDPALRDIKRKPKASPHDFRRTVATHLVESLKIDRITPQLVLGHSLNRIIESGVASTYDRGDAMDERRVALDRFAAWLMEQITPSTTGGKVIAINQ